MDPRLLRYYNQELQHLREMGTEFSRQFPKIAGRLGMDGTEVLDPYVERLLEGVGFMAARIQVKLDAEFPRFTQRLQEIVYPNYLAPTPSMLIARFQPQPDEADLVRGVTIPRGSTLRATPGGEGVACEFRTAQEVTLWPIEVADARYFSYAPDLPLTALPGGLRIKGGLRLRLRTTAGVAFGQLPLDDLRLFLSGGDEVACRLYELCLGACAGVLVAPPARPLPWHVFLPREAVRPAGFSDSEALLPPSLRSFQGYRLVQEYFTFPQRFLFVDVCGIGSALRRHAGSELEIVLLFERGDATLESVVDAANVALFCTPAINLFPKRADRIHLDDATHEYHVVPDRARPMDYEVYEVDSVVGHGSGAESEQRFAPMYAACHADDPAGGAYFTTAREPRLLSEQQKRNGARSGYIGSEVFISLVDTKEAPYRRNLRQLAVNALCTNRDLPLLMPVGAGETGFSLDIAAPVAAVRCIKGPSRPAAPNWDGAAAWRFISHLSLNYLSLMNTGEREGAAALRQMLTLYATAGESGMARQIEALRGVRAAPVVRRLEGSGPIAFGRGIRIDLDVDEMGFQGGSAFLFGSVLAEFFARHASINAFTETALSAAGRGTILQGRPRCGTRPIL